MKIDIENPKAVLEDILTRINNGEYAKVVRCKDCKHYDGNGTCMKIGIAMLNDDWFCADAKPKEKTDDKK